MGQSYAHRVSNSFDDHISTTAIVNGDISGRDAFGYGAPSIVSRHERSYNCSRWLQEQNFFGRLDFTPEYDEFWKQAEPRGGSREAKTEKEKETELKELKSQLRDRDDLIARLQGLISAVTPSTEIGVAIRHRFLEKERMSIAKLDGQVNGTQRQDIIDKGNAAAHGGNGTADASLFKRDLLPEEHKQVFRHLYKVEDGDQYLCMPLKLRRARDIQREEVTQKLVEIETLHTTLGTEAFQQSPDVDDLLADAEALKENIVKTYKQRFNRNSFHSQGCGPNC